MSARRGLVSTPARYLWRHIAHFTTCTSSAALLLALAARRSSTGAINGAVCAASARYTWTSPTRICNKVTVQAAIQIRAYTYNQRWSRKFHQGAPGFARADARSKQKPTKRITDEHSLLSTRQGHRYDRGNDQKDNSRTSATVSGDEMVGLLRRRSVEIQPKSRTEKIKEDVSFLRSVKGGVDVRSPNPTASP